MNPQLSKFNSARNLLEHEFKKPDRKDVEMAYDIAFLLYYATIRFTKMFLYTVDLETEEEGLRMVINRDNKEMKVEIFSTLHDTQIISVAWGKKSEDYKEWLRILYQSWYLS